MTLPDRICDPHHHLWEVRGMEYAPDDLLADLATVPHVSSTVFVECDARYRTSGPEHLRVVGETEWAVANGPPIIAGIVGAGDLRLGPRTVEMLEAHVEAGDGRFRGIRQRATWDAHPSIRPSVPYAGQGLLLDPWFGRGLEVLESLGLSFDAWMYFPQLPDLVALARAHPDATIVLDHLGGPITLGPYHDRDATHAAWRRLLPEVARCENVVLKVGGHGMPMYLGRPLREAAADPGGLLGAAAVADLWGDAIRFSIDAFGPDRCMFESNFPVDKLSMSYATLWEAFDLIATDYSPDERNALFHDTAVRTYRLDERLREALMTEITEDTPFTPDDDTYHVPTVPDPLWFETAWFSFSVPERRIGGWLHAGRHTNQGTMTWRVFLWDPRGADPARMAYYRIASDVPFGATPTGEQADLDETHSVDLRDVTFPEGGWSIKVLDPLMDYHVTYADPDARFGIEFEHRSVHPPHRFTPGEAPCVHNPHIDQLGHLTGELVLDGERIPLDCYSVRDRTWGPRSRHHSHGAQPPTRQQARVADPGGPAWREIERERGRGRIQYIFGHAWETSNPATGCDTGFLSFVRTQDGTADGWSPLNMGWLLLDGRFTRLDTSRSRMKNYRHPDTGWSAHMEVDLVDREGRTMQAEGVALSHNCEHGNGANAFMRWDLTTSDGRSRTGWGEDQDGWRTDHFARMLRALRAG